MPTHARSINNSKKKYYWRLRAFKKNQNKTTENEYKINYFVHADLGYEKNDTIKLEASHITISRTPTHRQISNQKRRRWINLLLSISVDTQRDRETVCFVYTKSVASRIRFETRSWTRHCEHNWSWSKKISVIISFCSRFNYNDYSCCGRLSHVTVSLSADLAFALKLNRCVCVASLWGEALIYPVHDAY